MADDEIEIQTFVVLDNEELPGLGHFDASKNEYTFSIDKNVIFNPGSTFHQMAGSSTDVNSNSTEFDVNFNEAPESLTAISDEDIIEFVQDNSIVLSAAVHSPMTTSKPVSTMIHNDVEKIVYCTWSPRLSVTFESPKKSVAAKKEKVQGQAMLENLNNFNLNLKWFLNGKVYTMDINDKKIEIGTLDTKNFLLKGNLVQVVKYILAQALEDPWNYSLRGGQLPKSSKKLLPQEILSSIEKFFFDTKLLDFYKGKIWLHSLVKKQVCKALRCTNEKKK